MAMSGTASRHSQRHSPDNLDSPQSGHVVRPVVSSPWNQVVRRESEPTAAPPLSPSPMTLAESCPSVLSSLPMDDSSLDVGSVANGNMGKRPAWNKPSNGADSEAKPVMGAISWPALSESTKATMKSSTESPQGGADGSSVSQLQDAGITSSSSQRQGTDNASPNNVVPTRQKSIKRNGPNASFNGYGGHLQHSAPQGQITATGFHNTSPKDQIQRSGFMPHNHNVNDHLQQRNSFRNRNGGPHQRGDGIYHHNYGSRREQDRANQDWHTHRNFNGRDSHMSPRVIPRLVRTVTPPPPPSSGQFIPPPPPVRPFGGPVGFPELTPPVVYVAAPPPDSLRGVPFVPPLSPHPMFFPAPDPLLSSKIVNQIDYYFSGDNLIKDTFLRQKMDEQGWVPIQLIAGFKKVMELTDNVPFILDALRNSSVVEVQDDQVRRRKDWQRWILPASVHTPDGSQSFAKFSHDMLLAVQNISLEHNDSSDTSQNKSSFGVSNSQLQHSSVEGTSEVGIQGSDQSVDSRN